jgi:hypothetical protein
MNASDIKAELRVLIENETDLHILEAIKTLLKKSSLDPQLKEKLTARALKSEEDIKKGRLLNRNDFEQKLNTKVGL